LLVEITVDIASLKKERFYKYMNLEPGVKPSQGVARSLHRLTVRAVAGVEWLS
jgi:hypothetical protein